MLIKAKLVIFAKSLLESFHFHMQIGTINSSNRVLGNDTLALLYYHLLPKG